MVCKILSPWSDERAGTPKSVAQIAVAHFSILQSPHPCWLCHVRHCARSTPAVQRLFALGAAGVENILRERHARVGPGADVDPPHHSKLSGF
jgi:hypothetical protein